MFTLFYGFWKYLFKKDEYFILILGLDNAGKTTFLEQAKGKCNPEYKMMNPAKITSTVGLNSFVSRFSPHLGRIDIDSIRLNFWDLGGQEELQALWDKYYAECHGVIYVIDSSDKERLNESWTAFDKILESENLNNVPLLVACNKQDIDVSSPTTSCPCIDPSETRWTIFGNEFSVDVSYFDNQMPNGSSSTVNLSANSQKEDQVGTVLSERKDCLSVADIKTVFHESVPKIGNRDCTVLPVSALSGKNIEEGINWMCQAIKRNSFHRPPTTDKSIT